MFGFLKCCCCNEASATPKIEEVPCASVSSHGASSSVWNAAATGNLNELMRHIRLGANINEPDPCSTPRSKGRTPLILAARAGHEEVVRTLLDQPGVNVNATTEDSSRPARSQQTALHWATRENYPEIVTLLLDHKAIDPNAKTKFGFTSCMVAAQGGLIDCLKVLCEDPRVDLNYDFATPENADLGAVMVSIIEGNEESIKVLLNTGRSDGPSLTYMPRTLNGQRRETCLMYAVTTQHSGIVSAFLAAKADPDLGTEQGKRPLEHALESGATEIVMQLMLAGASTDGLMTPLRAAQMMGNAVKCEQLVMNGTVSAEDNLPDVHKHIFTKNLEALEAELAKIGNRASTILDGGNMPAAFWAIELGHWDMVSKILTIGHGMAPDFVDKLVQGKFGQITKTKSSVVGERVFEVFMSLLAHDANITNSTPLAKGAFAVLKPFCGSVSCLQYFSDRPQDFERLCQACKEQCSAIYDRIDGHVSVDALKRAGRVGLGCNTKGIRQDMPGLAPHFKYVRCEATNMNMGGNHEFFTAMSLALAGYAINEVFEAEMKTLLGDKADVKEAPSKTFGRMYNKLMNKTEHGDPTIPKPRPMKNVDIDRVGAVIKEVEQLERAFDALQGKFKILRIKNNYDPTGGEGFGGYRSLLVNFEYTSGLTYAELFGSGHYTGEVHEALDPVAQMWLDYVETLRPVSDWRWGLQGLWRVARLDPDCEVVLASEVQMIMEAYMTGRHMSHLLYKISRCETGPSEMARDFATSFTATSETMLQKAEQAAKHASKVKERKKG